MCLTIVRNCTLTSFPGRSDVDNYEPKEAIEKT